MFSVIVPINALEVQSDTITVELPINQMATDSAGDNEDKVVISYTLTAENTTTPMPDDTADNGNYVFTVVGNRQYIKLPIRFLQEGTYHYCLTANSVNAVVKPVMMNITVYIFDIDGILTPYIVSSLSDGKKTDGIYFTADYVGDEIPTQLPTEKQSEISTEISTEKQSDISTEIQTVNFTVPNEAVTPTDSSKDRITDWKSVFLTGEHSRVNSLLFISAVALFLIILTATKKQKKTK